MKKYYILLFTVLFLLTGCSKQKNATLESPASVYTKEGTISYYDTKDKLKDNSILSNIVCNENGCIRAINIAEPKYITYPNISVGDDISKVEDDFSYEYKATETSYCVLFDGTNEVDPTADNKEDNWIWINYIFDSNDKITNISIYDVKYGREMR